MAKGRKKSLADIEAQSARLRQAAEDNYNFDRMSKIADITERYRNNIQNYGRKAVSQVKDTDMAGNVYGPLRSKKGDWNGKFSSVSQNIYMGNSKG